MDAQVGVDLFEHSPAPTWVVDPEGRIQAVNAAGAALLGRPAAELVGQSAAALLGGRDIELTKAAITFRGAAAELVVGRDAAAERASRETYKMEALTRLTGKVVHDVNNILSVVLSYAEFLVTDLGSGHPSLADAEEIKRSGRRAADLMARLMAFSKRAGMSLSATDLHAELGALQPKLTEAAGPTITLQIAPEAPRCRATCEAAALEIVLSALVENAREAMPDGGKITIATANATVDERDAERHAGARTGSFVVISVADEGGGMDPVARERAFEPFFTTKARGKGTGLGLATVFGFAAGAGGHVRVDTPGRGVKVSIYLPEAR